ncbi:hypothetical protein D3C71_925380 [compost metagenome]
MLLEARRQRALAVVGPGQGGDRHRRQLAGLHADVLAQRAHQAVAVHAGHADIGQQHVDAGMAALVQQRQRFAGRGRGSHFRALLLQQPAQVLQHFRLVLHRHQVQALERVRLDHLIADRATEYFAQRSAIGLRLVARQAHGEGGTVAVALAAGRDRAAVQLHQLLGDGQAQPEAAVAPGGGAIGLAEAAEQVAQELRGDAIAAVGDADRPVPAIAAQGHRHGAFGRGEFDRIGEQVPQHLLQARGIAEHQRRVVGQDQAHLQGLALGHQFLGTHGFGQLRAQVQHLHFQLYLAQQHAAEVEHVRDQPLLRHRAVGDHAQALVQRAGVVHPLQQQFAPAQDGGQRGAQFVGQGGQELVLEPRHVFSGTARGTLGLQQFLAGHFDFAALGHIRAAAGQADEAAHAREARARVHFQPAPLAIGAAAAHQGVHGALRLQRFLQFVLEHRGIVGMDQAAPDIFRHALIAAKELGEGAVDEARMAALIEHPHRHRQAVGERAETGLAFGQLHLDLLAAGDVEEHHGHAVLARLAHAHGFHRVPAPQATGLQLELLGLPAQGHLAVDAEPVGLVPLDHGTHALPGGVDQPGVALEGVIDLQEAVVDRQFLLEQHLDHAEAGVHLLQHAAVHAGIECGRHEGRSF